MNASEGFIEILSNLVNILIVVAAILYAIDRVINFMKLSKEEQKEAALKIIKEELLKLMIEAEKNWDDISKSGKIKRSEVITELYNRFPILKEFKDQDKLLEELDKMIDDTKVIMDKIIEENTKKEEVVME